jgi:hypothetical protein
LKKHVTWTRIVTTALGHVPCHHVQPLIELHCVTSVALARLMAEGMRCKNYYFNEKKHQNILQPHVPLCRRSQRLRALMTNSASIQLSSSLSASADMIVVKESILALAIVKDGHVTLHSIESEDAPADAANHRDEACKRLFAETIEAGGSWW